MAANPQQAGQAQAVILNTIQNRIVELRREANELEAALAVMFAPPPAAAAGPGADMAAVLAAGKKLNGSAVAEVGAGRT